MLKFKRKLNVQLKVTLLMSGGKWLTRKSSFCCLLSHWSLRFIAFLRWFRAWDWKILELVCWLLVFHQTHSLFVKFDWFLNDFEGFLQIVECFFWKLEAWRKVTKAFANLYPLLWHRLSSCKWQSIIKSHLPSFLASLKRHRRSS